MQSAEQLHLFPFPARDLATLAPGKVFPFLPSMLFLAASGNGSTFVYALWSLLDALFFSLFFVSFVSCTVVNSSPSSSHPFPDQTLFSFIIQAQETFSFCGKNQRRPGNEYESVCSRRRQMKSQRGTFMFGRESNRVDNAQY